jgi:glycosyltransferase involved in cell wall biosynthesis
MRLGFHYHVPATSRDGSVYMPGYLGVFIDGLAELCENLTCFMHEPPGDETWNLDYRIRSSNVRLISIGVHTSVPKRVLSSRRTKKIILAEAQELDLMLVRAPTPLTHLFSARFGTPVALFIVGDNVKGTDQMAQPFWRKALIRLLWKWNHKHQMRIARESLVFVNSESMYKELRSAVKKIVEVKSTTLRKSDIFLRDDTCQREPVILLYVGRFERSKGLFELYEALSHLNSEGVRFHLHLVGWASKKDKILAELNELADKLNISEQITNFGYKEMGTELFNIYRNADIFTMPTKFDTFPRTITEAMGNSLPVIATRVGGIPYRLENDDNAVLIEPGDSVAMGKAVKRVVRDGELRRRLIREGRKLAEQNTLETQSKKMMSELEKYIEKPISAQSADKES